MLGEDEFSIVLHQGAMRNILMYAISEDALLAVIFSSPSSVGLVKLYAPLTADSIRTVLEQAANSGEEVDGGMQSFVVTEDGDLFGLEDE